MRIDLGAISSLCIFGNDFYLLIGLEIHKDGRATEYGTNLLGIEDVKEYHLITAIAERLDSAHDAPGVLVKVGDHDSDAATVKKFLEMMQGLRKIGTGVGLGTFEGSEEATKLAGPRRGPEDIAHLFIEDDKSGGIALVVNGEIEEGRGDEASVIHLLRRTGGVLHACAATSSRKGQ